MSILLQFLLRELLCRTFYVKSLFSMVMVTNGPFSVRNDKSRPFKYVFSRKKMLSYSFFLSRARLKNQNESLFRLSFG